MVTPRVGVLALQGNIREHAAMLGRLGAAAVPVRRGRDLDAVDALVLPGGESSVIDKLLRRTGMREPLAARLRDGMPALGTCAGLILLADRLEGGIEGQETLGGLDVTVRRNAFGRQNESFEAEIDVPALGAPPVAAAFIRAPVVTEVGQGAVALAALPDGRVVCVEQGALIGVSFHPEETGETRFHRRLLASIA